MQIVWFKRDLRTTDHAPLVRAMVEASSAGSVLPLYLHEPFWWAQPDTSGQHQAFSRECVTDLAGQLKALGGTLFEPVGDAVTVLEALWQQTRFSKLLSYQETGLGHTFERDKAVKAWCKTRGVAWLEFSQNGVYRGAQFREKGFSFRRHLTDLLTQAVQLPAELSWVTPPWGNAALPAVRQDKPWRQRGGRSQAMALLAAFLSPEKLLAYPRAISSPNTALEGCSRLSPYLAFGVLSDGEVIRALYEKRLALLEHLSEEKQQSLDQAVKFFVERLYWRAAYHQSFELNVESEHQPELSTLAGHREGVFIPAWLEAWKAGRTGVPYVDAAMRMLAQTGWVNMRLRGTVSSFALNELWLPWREVGLHLAREFLDYDGAIHWSQVQIQAGSAAGCEPLSYDPRKQARDHDPQGAFVRQWVPELANVPMDYLVEPWTMSPRVQAQTGCHIGVDYPAPLVNLAQAHAAARERVAALRQGITPPRNNFWGWREQQRVVMVQGGLF